MRYILRMPTNKIQLFAMIIDSYEDVGVITTIKHDTENHLKSNKSYSILLANISDDYDKVFFDIIKDLNEEIEIIEIIKN